MLPAAAWRSTVHGDAFRRSLLSGERIRPLRRVEYEKLAEQGCFDDERVELLFGVVVEMTPTDPPHNTSVYHVRRAIERAVGERAIVREQSSFAASDISEPEPDVFVIPNGDYWSVNPTRAFLVVEVADSSLRKDRGLKARLYATSDVAEYWVVDVVNGTVEVFRDAERGKWKTITLHRRGERVAMRAFPDVEVAVAEVVPPEPA